MRFSRWRAAGNEYLLVERAELGEPLTPERVRAEVGGSDGILEVVAADGARGGDRDLEPRRLDCRAVRERNADRRALAGGAERGGRGDDPRRPAARSPRGCCRTARSSRTSARSRSTSGSGSRDSRSSPVSVGNPHAVVVGDPDDLPLIGPLLETHPRFPERTNVQVARVDCPGRGDRAGVGARRRGDAARPERARSRSPRRPTARARSSSRSPAAT